MVAVAHRAVLDAALRGRQGTAGSLSGRDVEGVVRAGISWTCDDARTRVRRAHSSSNLKVFHDTRPIATAKAASIPTCGSTDDGGEP